MYTTTARPQPKPLSWSSYLQLLRDGGRLWVILLRRDSLVHSPRRFVALQHKKIR